MIVRVQLYTDTVDIPDYC